MAEGVIWLPQWKRKDIGAPAERPYRNGMNIKLLWHTWEGTNWSAAESAFAPYPPHVAAKIGGEVRQYVPLDMHAFALAGSHNEDEFVIQVEVAGFAHDSRDMTEDEKAWLAHNVLEPILFFHDVPDVHPPFYDDQDGITLASKYSPIRFTQEAWANYSGHVGHQHAPNPDAHWDPGKLDVDTIIRIARQNGHQVKEDDMGWTEDRDAVLAALKAQGEALARLEDSVHGGSGVLPLAKQTRDALLPADATDKPLGVSSVDNQLKALRRAERRIASAVGVTSATKPVDGKMLES